MLDLDQLRHLQQQPEPFAPGATLFWDDPHISQSLLAAHLDPSTPAASRHPREIDDSVVWVIDLLSLHPGASLLDLGCGPGLYASRFAARGLHVTGVDYSRRSIDVYRNWFQDYTSATISAELRAHGFTIHSLWDDLRGTPLSDTGEWIGIVAQKV